MVCLRRGGWLPFKGVVGGAQGGTISPFATFLGGLLCPHPPSGFEISTGLWRGSGGVLYFSFISMDFTDPWSSSRIIDGESGVPDPIE